MRPRRFPMGTRGREQGMSLFECLVYVVLLTVLINVVVSAHVSATRLSLASVAALDRLSCVANAGEALCDTVREARGVVESVGAYRTGPSQVVLSLPADPVDGAPRYVVLGHSPEANRLWRMEVAQRQGAFETVSYSKCALAATGLRIDYGGAPPNARLVTFEIETPNAANRKDREAVVYRFMAALRTAPARGAP